MTSTADRDPEGSGARRRGPCPDPNLLAAFAEGSLLSEERESVERHVAGCEECGAAVAAATAAVEEPEHPVALSAPRPTSRPLVRWAAAAAALLLVGLGVAAALGRLPGLRRPEPDALTASATLLARERPDLFGGFAPLSTAERAVGPRPVLRGNGVLTLIRPAGRVVEARPLLVWQGRDGVARWAVEVQRLDGTVLWRRETTASRLAWPADAAELEPGLVHTWAVSGSTPAGDLKGSHVFETASADDRRAFADARRAIRERAPSRLAPLLEAQFAYRKGYLSEAEDAARAAVSLDPANRVAAETLARILRELGVDGP